MKIFDFCKKKNVFLPFEEGHKEYKYSDSDEADNWKHAIKIGPYKTDAFLNIGFN